VIDLTFHKGITMERAFSVASSLFSAAFAVLVLVSSLLIGEPLWADEQLTAVQCGGPGPENCNDAACGGEEYCCYCTVYDAGMPQGASCFCVSDDVECLDGQTCPGDD